MKAVGYRKPLPIESPESLLDIAIAEPVADGRDLLVEIKAVSANPVDVKVRSSSGPTGSEYKVLGWDAAGVVRGTGPQSSMFKPGDEVFYAGSLMRPGTNAELHLVDERIVGRKPTTLSFAEAAALPLTAITAWEMLFDRLQIPCGDQPDRDALLLIGGGGGVGSIAIQLAHRLTGLRVIATASRPETRDWCLSLGAHDVVDHTGNIPAQLKAIGAEKVRYVFSTTNSDAHWPSITAVVAPQGRVGLIDDPEELDVRLLKRKSTSLHWEWMFTRSMFETGDMAEQGALLNKVARLVEAGTLKTTVGECLGTISAENLRRAHALLESGRTRGKIVLAGF
jgi:zinc-binding alcohol dehydrogenase family protein